VICAWKANVSCSELFSLSLNWHFILTLAVGLQESCIRIAAALRHKVHGMHKKKLQMKDKQIGIIHTQESIGRGCQHTGPVEGKK
jgi:hypothetical protein